MMISALQVSSECPRDIAGSSTCAEEEWTGWAEDWREMQETCCRLILILSWSFRHQTFSDWCQCGLCHWLQQSLHTCTYAVPEWAGLLRNLTLVWSLTHFCEAMLLPIRHLPLSVCGSPSLSNTPIICFYNVWCLNYLKHLAAVLQEGQMGKLVMAR